MPLGPTHPNSLRPPDLSWEVSSQSHPGACLPCASKNSSSELSSESRAILCILHSEMLWREGLAGRQNPRLTDRPPSGRGWGQRQAGVRCRREGRKARRRRVREEGPAALTPLGGSSWDFENRPLPAHQPQCSHVPVWGRTWRWEGMGVRPDGQSHGLGPPWASALGRPRCRSLNSPEAQLPGPWQEGRT